MKFVADFHIHSKYSRAVSQKMSLEELDIWANHKGILVMGTGDFTHPKWFLEIKQKLEPAENGLFKLKPEYKLKNILGRYSETRFILSVEISSIYSQAGKVRRIHNVIILPDIESVQKLNNYLNLVGNISSDGRPILGLSSKELLKIVLNICPKALFIPAHIWTPWFSLFGSMSGFDSIEECFGEYSKYILAIETGLSSDPQMNWRIPELDGVAILSNSDSHSVERIGREANIFETDLSYDGIFEAIQNSAPLNIKEDNFSLLKKPKILETIEFFPEEGKYHYDGHRLCQVLFSPIESKKHHNICPKCGKPLTIGVMNRVEKLAKRQEDFFDPKRPPYKKLITLDEIIADALGVGKSTKAVYKIYNDLILNFENELNVLLNVSILDIQSVSGDLIAEGIKRVRDGKLYIIPGYDGEYGKIFIFNEDERKKVVSKNTLF
ncbi:MAG: endonuclease Q family protein [Patescibacteria group bacterium]|nr:endonuclease Q family protein [Patescibacteria group bacterium]MCX7589717.1 endonuclease Q family protein [Patescibacteria group bacterium]